MDRVSLRHIDVVVATAVVVALSGGDSKLLRVAPVAAAVGVSLMVRALTLRVSIASCRDNDVCSLGTHKLLMDIAKSSASRSWLSVALLSRGDIESASNTSRISSIDE